MSKGTSKNVAACATNLMVKSSAWTATDGKATSATLTGENSATLTAVRAATMTTARSYGLTVLILVKEQIMVGYGSGICILEDLVIMVMVE